MTDKKSLRLLISEACEILETYRHPDVIEAQSRINELLQAARIGSIAHANLERLELGAKTLDIETSWSARGCPGSSEYSLPVFILDAADPIAAATLWGLDERIGPAAIRVKSAQVLLRQATADLEELQSQRLVLTGSAVARPDEVEEAAGRAESPAG